jgi:hypothetical protein
MAVLCLSLASCQASCAGKAPPTLSPAGTAAFNATRVVKALDILRDFAVDGEAQTPPVISTDNTRKVVAFHRAAVTTIGAVPGGWKPVVTTGLDQLQHDLLPEEWRRILPYVALVKSAIEVSQ